MTYESTAPDLIFQSTLSVRRATAARTASKQFTIFQSTLSVRRATRVELDLTFTSDFNPRSP